MAEEAPLYDSIGATSVVWVEADPSQEARLKTAIADRPTHSIIMAAISDRCGTIQLRRQTRRSFNSILPRGSHPITLILPGPPVEDADIVEVESRTIDSLKLSDIQLLSMDIQGAELLALRGATELLQNPQLEHIFTECIHVEHYVGGVTRTDYIEFLTPFGFALVAEDAEWGAECGNLLFSRST
jgi:FkbM family methyltransferase